MKLFLIFTISSLAASGFVACAPHFASPDRSISTGTSKQFRTEDNLGNFNFGYDESHNTGATSRREESNNGVRRGMYSLYDADGRRRIVNYIADKDGFRAHVQTNEPGYASKDSADVLVNKNQQQQAVASVAAQAYAVPRTTYSDAPVKDYSAPAPIKRYALSAPAPVKTAYAAPVRTAYAAPVKTAYSAPLQAPVKSYAPPAPVKGYSVPVVQAPIYQQPEAAPEPEAPWAFSYSFDSTHAAPVKTYDAPSAVKSFLAPAPVKSVVVPAALAPVQQEQEQEQVQVQVQVQAQAQAQQQEEQQQQDQQSFDY